MTGSASADGLASALGVAPYILLSPPVGVWVDRWNRQQVMVWCNLGRAAVASCVVLASLLTMTRLYAVALLQRTLLVFFNRAEVVAWPRVVARGQLPEAIAQSPAGHAGAAIAGTALGTWLLQQGGRVWPLAVNALGLVASAASVWRLALMLAPALLWSTPTTLAAVYVVYMFCAPVYNVVQLCRRLAMIPEGLQGRANSAFRLAASLLVPAGAGLYGLMVDLRRAGGTLGLFAAALGLLALAAALGPVLWRGGLGAPVGG